MTESGYCCPACSSAMVYVNALHDDRYGFPGEFSLYRCPKCNHHSLNTEMTASQITDLYTNYYPRSEMDVTKWEPPTEAPSFRRWWSGLGSSAFRWVPPNVRILDIGCGFGQSLGYHRNRGCDAHGVEADENILRVAERYKLNVKTGLFDADDYEPDSFDYVTLDQVVEHVSDPATLLAGVNKVLRPGGIAIISTPNVDGWGTRLFRNKWIHWHAPYHQQFFSVESMQLVAKKEGFETIDVKTITNSEWLHYQWLHLLTYPAAGQPSAFWSAQVQVRGFRQTIMKVLNIAHLMNVNHLVTRLFDLTGAGDNRVYFLRKP